MDLKLKEEKDIDKMISIEKQLMVAPKGPTFNGRPTFANPMYLKKAQSEKPCLYEIPYDKSDPANRLVPDREATPTLKKESQSKLNKDKELVDQAWEKHSHDHFRAPTAHDMEILIKTCLMPLALKTQNDSFTFVHELKQEMHANLKYIESLEKEIDELESDKAEFSNMYDLLLQECVSKDVTKSSFAKPYDVNAPGPSRNNPKHVSFQSPRESVGLNDMVHNYYLEEAKKKAQLQKDKALNTKPSVQQFARLPKTANGNKPKPRNFNQQLRNWTPSMSSHVSHRTVNIAEPPRKQTPFLTLNDLVGLKWIPIRKSVETCYNTNDSASPLGKKTHNPNTTICANSSSLCAGSSMASEPISSTGSSN
nr:hypothetical protein [Tanacetum cinerariifolium]